MEEYVVAIDEELHGRVQRLERTLMETHVLTVVFGPDGEVVRVASSFQTGSPLALAAAVRAMSGVQGELTQLLSVAVVNNSLSWPLPQTGPPVGPPASEPGEHEQTPSKNLPRGA